MWNKAREEVVSPKEMVYVYVIQLGLVLRNMEALGSSVPYLAPSVGLNIDAV